MGKLDFGHEQEKLINKCALANAKIDRKIPHLSRPLRNFEI
jgi:hypothetical protein